jgi:transcriptional regulatory protein LevR
VLSHGHVAAGMAEVANRLLGVNHAKAVEMSLDESPETALERTVELVMQIDEGKGVLFLVDMGSLADFGTRITELTGIPVRSVGPVYTMMVIEAVRRALLPEASLTELADSIGQSCIGMTSVKQELLHNPSGKPVILSVCITGQGAALQLQKELERKLGQAVGVEIICLGLADRQSFTQQVRQIMSTRTVQAVVGTLDPHIPGVPFITVEQVLSNNLPSVFKPMAYKPAALQDIIKEELIFFPNQEASKPQIIELLAESLISRNLVKPQFAADVMKRELIGVPVLSLRVAIPHGEDPRYIQQTSAALAVFPEAVPWGENYRVNIVCMLAVTADGKEIVQELGERLTNDDLVERLLGTQSAMEVREVLLQDL